MAVALTGSGGIFTAFGTYIGGQSDLVAMRGGTSTSRVGSGASFKARRNTIFNNYGNQSPANTNILVNLNNEFAQWSSAQSKWFTAMQQEMGNLLVQMCDNDTKLPSRTVVEAFKLLITQMINSGDSIQQATVSAGAQTAWSGITNAGNGKVVMSVINGYGYTLQYLYPELLKFVCSNDSFSGTASRNQEKFTVTGQSVISDTFSELWPGGSGASPTISTVDPAQQNSGTQKNILYNGAFRNFSNTNYPDNWVFNGTGAGAGTTMFNDTGNPFNSIRTSALKFLGAGGGANENSITQVFNTSPSVVQAAGGSPAIPSNDVPYAVGLWTRVSATPSAGVLTISLINQGGSIINDDNGNPNSFTIALTGETTSYAFHSGVFRLPAKYNLVSPNTLRLQITTSTAIDSGKYVDIAELAMTPMVQIYTGGPFVVIFPGTNGWTFGDTFSVTMANNYGGSQPFFNGYLQRTFNLSSILGNLPGYLQAIPFSGSPTINNNLIA